MISESAPSKSSSVRGSPESGSGGATARPLAIPDWNSVKFSIEKLSEKVNGQLLDYCTTSLHCVCCCELVGQQTMLSDIVVCGPASVCLAKPAVLSLPHCADSVDHQWSLTVIYHPLRTNQITAVTDAWRVSHALVLSSQSLRDSYFALRSHCFRVLFIAVPNRTRDCTLTV